ncbi:ABC transporter substrate-binding protein [Paenibacillus macerans]|uniref:ABC transporter substrate-binding protein n=1 Tax=Paenibacillus macerans TaxID=44252 RepID=UPI000DFD26EA|nr:ABC transporter substrate-binding protein [Paenibacillus macerans]SUA85369.1 HTH-type transcriptional regulator sgrR [Paenibacillus macerans]
MKLHHQYLLLHERYGAKEGEAAVAGVTLDELAAALDCTHRNALTIIRNMEERGWIGWTPRRGRGARSSLRFLARAEEIAAQSVMQAIRRKDVRQAIEDIRRHAGSSSLQDQLQGWLLSYFGHHAETRRDRQIDTLRLPVRQRLYTVDPLYMNLLAESFVSSHVFDGLVHQQSAAGELLPGIAHAWDVDAGRTEWTFYLRKGVLFHNGNLLTADDVVFTFERLAGSTRRALYSSIFKQIRTVRALNQNTVRIELKEQSELFLPWLCTSRAAIVPRNLDGRGEARFGVSPVGSGPFKVAEMNGDLCVLEAFPHYFQGQAHLDRIEIVYVPWNIAGEPGAGSDGDSLSPFHVIPNPTAAESEGWSQMHSRVSVRKFVTCNTRKSGPLSDPAVRARVFSALRGAAAEPARRADAPGRLGTGPGQDVADSVRGSADSTRDTADSARGTADSARGTADSAQGGGSFGQDAIASEEGAAVPGRDAGALGRNAAAAPGRDASALGWSAAAAPGLDASALGRSAAAAPGLDASALGRSAAAAPGLDASALGRSAAAAPGLDASALGRDTAAPAQDAAGSELLIATIAPYKPDADFVAGRLMAAGYPCRVLSASAEEFKGDIRLKSDLIVFSLLRDQDEQLRLFDLYQTVSEHVEPYMQIDIGRLLQAVALEQHPRRRATLFEKIETRLIAADELYILYEKPVQTAFLPSVRGVAFNSQGWVDLRNIWFPPKL